MTTEGVEGAASEPLVEGDAPQKASDSVAAPEKPLTESSPREVSAATIGRMMGLATVNELRLLEGKVDLLSTKLTSLMVKVDKLIAVSGNFPTGSDLERIDVQIGSLKNLIRETITGATGGAQAASQSAAPSDTKKKLSVFVKPEGEDAPKP